mmetsp:Transcript_19134/g.73188  ORF Transcript_19134/g.73188 Transcript_19134/m.73188 type:complete len:237 (+) Transcript_19134:118-828(+)
MQGRRAAARTRQPRQPPTQFGTTNMTLAGQLGAGLWGARAPAPAARVRPARGQHLESGGKQGGAERALAPVQRQLLRVRLAASCPEQCPALPWRQQWRPWQPRQAPFPASPRPASAASCGAPPPARASSGRRRARSLRRCPPQQQPSASPAPRQSWKSCSTTASWPDALAGGPPDGAWGWPQQPRGLTRTRCCRRQTSLATAPPSPPRHHQLGQQSRFPRRPRASPLPPPAQRRQI